MKNEKKFLICEAPLCKGSPTEGTEDAYSHLTGNGLKALFGERAVFSDYRGERCAGESGRRDMKHLETVMLVNRNVYTSLRRAHEEGYLPIMLGGDHSLAMASIAATSDVYGAGNVAVIYIDSHADINTEATSETGMIHGMPLAAAMGLCGDELNVGERKTHIYGKNVYIIGAHSIDRGEYPIIEREGVHLYTADDVRERGANDVASEVLASVRGMDVHLTLLFTHDYFGERYRELACSDGFFMPGYAEAAQAAAATAGDGKQIVSTYTRVAAPFVVALYATGTPPEEFRDTVVWKDETAEFRIASAFSDFVFGLPEDLSGIDLDRQVLILHQSELDGFPGIEAAEITAYGDFALVRKP